MLEDFCDLQIALRAHMPLRAIVVVCSSTQKLDARSMIATETGDLLAYDVSDETVETAAENEIAANYTLGASD